MAKRKPIRTRGKIQLSRQFQSLNSGDRVSIVREKSEEFKLPKRFQGITGIVAEKRGKVYAIKIKDQNKEKQLLISPIHLKKIKNL